MGLYGHSRSKNNNINYAYTYAESNSSDTETKANRTTSDQPLVQARDNWIQFQDTYIDHTFLLLCELPRTADLRHVAVIMPF